MLHNPEVMSKDSLGLLGYDSYTFLVENMERSRRFYVDTFDFTATEQTSQTWVQAHGQQGVVFSAGDIRVLVMSPLGQNSVASSYLRRHPAGIQTLAFRVRDLDKTRAVLASRAATFLDRDLHDEQGGGRYRSFDIATPLGDVAFRFVERNDYPLLAPGLEAIPGAAEVARKANGFSFQAVDHVTSNARTMQPIIAWYREVLGMEEFWRVQFHTEDVVPGRSEGTGLRSIVMHDPESGVKFATNEPLSPRFEDSQIAKFVRDNAGPGIQHIAFSVPSIIPTVRTLKTRGIRFLNTPKVYYNDLPARLQALKISNVAEKLSELEELEIELDGRDNKYMLQIFLQEAASLYDDERAGPFFYEIIQRCGDEGFGYGNFRALFESIERAQRSAPVAG